MPRALEQHRSAKVGDPFFHAFGHLRAQDYIELGGNHQRRLIDALWEARAIFPVLVNIAVPIETTAKAGLGERAHEHLEILVGEKSAVRTIRKAVEKAAAGGAKDAGRRSAHGGGVKLGRVLIEATQRARHVALKFGLCNPG